MEEEEDDYWEEEEEDEAQSSDSDGEAYARPITFVKTQARPPTPEGTGEEEGNYMPSFAQRRVVTPPPALGTEVKGFSKMAQKYMEKHGFAGRLGKNETGIRAPLEAMKRKEGAGLGFVPEASSLPGNRAFEEETLQRREELEEKKRQGEQRARVELELQNAWRKYPSSTLPSMSVEMDEYFPNDLVIAPLERAESAWRERESRYLREIQVNASLTAIKMKETSEQQTDLGKVKQRLGEIATIAPILQDLSTVTRVEQALLEFKALPVKVVEDFELANVPFLFLQELVDSRFESDEAFCLQVVRFIQIEFYFQQDLLLQVLEAKVFPLLARRCEACADLADMDAVYKDWRHGSLATLAPHASLFDIPLQRLFAPWVDLQVLLLLLPRWKSILLGVPELDFKREIANRVGERLASTGSLAVLHAWYTSDLLHKQDFALLCECVLQPQVRESEGGKFYLYCQFREVVKAAKLYLEWKESLPNEFLEDGCIAGRLRHLLGYALELLRMSIDNKPVAGGVDEAIFNAIEPNPHGSLQQARANFLLCSTRAKQVATDNVVMGSLKNAVESLALGLGINFHASDAGGFANRVDGKQVYLFGSALCYFSQGVVYAKSPARGGGDWAPVSMSKLIEMAQV